RQLRFHINMECQEVANDVVVFRTIEPVYGADPAWLWTCRPGTIDFILEPYCGCPVSGSIRPRSPRRRHGACAQFFDHAFPCFRLCARIADIERVKRKPRGMKLF